jgi:hypothetical protein
MRALSRSVIAACVLGLAGTPALSQDALQESHIDANVPEPLDFDKSMRRDLLAYFQAAQPGTTSVDWVLLRQGATQSGVAYPKFYAWVRVSARSLVPRQGAVRLAAIDGTHFEVTTYLSAEDVRANPERVGAVFPARLVQAVESKAAEATR